MIINTHPRTFIHFANVKSFTDETETSIACSFNIQMHGMGHKEYRFIAETSADYQKWIAAIRTATAMRKTHNKQPYPDNSSILNLAISVDRTNSDNGTIRSHGRRSIAESQSSPKAVKPLDLPHIVEPGLDEEEPVGMQEPQSTNTISAIPKVTFTGVTDSGVELTASTEEENVAKLYMEQYPNSRPSLPILRHVKSHDDIGLTIQLTDNIIVQTDKRSTSSLSTTSTDSTPHSQISFTTALCADLRKPSTQSLKDPTIQPAQPTRPTHQFSIPRKVSTFFRTTFTPIHLQPSTTSLKSFLKSPLPKFQTKQPTQTDAHQPLNPGLRADSIPSTTSFVPPARGRARATSNPLQPDQSILSMVLAPWSGDGDGHGKEFGNAYLGAGLKSASCEDLRLGEAGMATGRGDGEIGEKEREQSLPMQGGGGESQVNAVVVLDATPAHQASVDFLTDAAPTQEAHPVVVRLVRQNLEVKTPTLPDSESPRPVVIVPNLTLTTA